jgi:hypothetical protein
VDLDRTLTPSAFPGDDGRAAPVLRAALERAHGSTEVSAYLGAVAALGGERVLVPVTATATRLGTTVGGLHSDREAEMAVVSLVIPDGRRGLLGFTGLDALQAWDAAARPVPVTLDVAAQAAVADGATALLVDVAGPHPLVLEGDILAGLAAGRRLVELADGSFGWASVVPGQEPSRPERHRQE